MGTRQRHTGLLGLSLGAVLVVVAFASLVSGVEPSEGKTQVSALAPGDCFLYPGDGVEPVAVEVTDCAQTHYGEVFAVTEPGDTDSCVDLFESYTGAGNYWETGYILGFIDVDAENMLCYLFGPEDFAGSLRA